MSALETVKTVPNAVLYKDNSGQLLIRLDNVRFSYPFLGTPAEDENDDGVKSRKWRVVGMLPKITHVAAKDLCKEVILKLIKDNDSKVPLDKWFLGNGDDKEDESMAGHWLVSASDGKLRPRCRDRKGHIIDEIEKIDEIFYGGMWGSMLIRPWFFAGKSKSSTKTYPKRVSAGISGVMFLKDDTPFGTGRVDDTDAWDVPAAEVAGDDGMGDDEI